MKQQNKLKEGWQEVELGEITECLDGKRIPITESDRKEGKVPYYGANGQVGWIDKPIFNEELLLVAEDGGSWGKGQKCSYIIDGEAWVNNHAHVLKIIKSKAEIKFLMYWLNNSDLNKYISGTTRGKLNQKVMNKIKILIPSTHIQKKIVSILEKAEGAKRKREEADKKTNEYLKSVFYEIFKNYLKDKNKFSRITEFVPNDKNSIKAGPFGSSLKKDCYVKSGYKIYGQEQVIKDDLSFGDYYISKDKYLELESYKVKEGDILISLVGTYGKISIVPKNFQEGIINPRLMKITLDKEKMIPLFFKFLFNSPIIKIELENISHGGTMDILNVGIIKKVGFPLPPLPLQQKFAKIVKQVEIIKEKQKESKEKINNMFDALMQKAFRGEL